MIKTRKLKKIHKKIKKVKDEMIEFCAILNCKDCFFLDEKECKGIMAINKIDHIIKKAIIEQEKKGKDYE